MPNMNRGWEVLAAAGGFVLLTLWWFGFLYAALEEIKWLALGMLAIAVVAGVVLAIREGGKQASPGHVDLPVLGKLPRLRPGRAYGQIRGRG